MPPELVDPTARALLASIQTAGAETRAALERQEALTAQFARYLAIAQAPPGVIADALPHWPVEPGHPDLISAATAARRAACSKSTIARWCRTHGIGKLYGEHWRISCKRLSVLIAAK